ncbi:MAG: YdcH family protein [Reyranellaceae bacterium]
MSHVPHDLHAEFPDHAEALHRLKLEDRHFQTLAERYQTVNREIHRIETETEAASDERLETLKKQRLSLVDEIAGLLSKHKAK